MAADCQRPKAQGGAAADRPEASGRPEKVRLARRNLSRRSRNASPDFRPRAVRAARNWLSEIGLPQSLPFRPDPFQTEAVRLVAKADVLVSAPTGSGKTWIAEQAMDGVLARGGRAWYASPLKALSNAKYLEFSARFGQDLVGILTGDRKENPGGPIIVGTTEILRNQLYDAMAQGQTLGSDLVVLDEAHFLADPDRGVVWEEVIIYLPPRVRLLLLSATLANAEELADWLLRVRRQPCRVVRARGRPVPLKPLFLAPDGELRPLIEKGWLAPGIEHLLRGKKNLNRPMPLDRVLKALEVLDLLPTIIFLTSRADCDQALSFARQKLVGRWAESRARMNQTLDQFLGQHPFLKTHPQIHFLRRHAVASHHAGHLPHFRLLIERLMQAGLLRAIFATSTVAAGVNFPARTVVLPQSDRFNGHEFTALSATEMMQMTGRAGRRGMDKVGFVAFTPGPHQDLRLAADLLSAPPEPIESQMRLSFSMVLNLLLSHSPEQIKPVLSLSLAAFQTAGQAQGRRPEYLDELTQALTQSSCGGLEEAILTRRRLAQAQDEMARVENEWDDLLRRLRLMSLLQPGRVFIDQRRRAWLVQLAAERRGRAGVVATPLTIKMKLKRGRLRRKFIPLERIQSVTATLVPLKPDKLLIHDLRRLDDDNLGPPPPDFNLSPESQAILNREEERLNHLHQTVAASPCAQCRLQSRCLNRGRFKLARQLDQAEKWFERLAQEEEKLWISFLRRLEFLKTEGFADQKGKLTPRGRWAAGLRLDHPLAIAEAIHRQALPVDDPSLLAGLMAPFVLDRDRAWTPVDKKSVSGTALHAAFLNLEREISPFLDRQKTAGFSIPQLRLSPTMAVFRWASGEKWEDLARSFLVEPGDLASLIFRTAENLRQLVGLKTSHPALAAAAERARDLILREPVVVPL